MIDAIDAAAGRTSGHLTKDEPYAVGKLAGIMQVQALRRQFGRRYLSVIPCNLYGPDDHFDNPGAHVIPMLMHRLHLAKMSGDSEFTIYGTGRPRREFLQADDMAAACVRLMNYYDGDLPVNIGSGEEVTIDELTRMIAAVIGFQGSFTHDTSKPDGVEGQVLDSSRLRETGWSPKVSLAEGLASTYMAYLKRL